MSEPNTARTLSVGEERAIVIMLRVLLETLLVSYPDGLNELEVVTGMRSICEGDV